LCTSSICSSPLLSAGDDYKISIPSTTFNTSMMFNYFLMISRVTFNTLMMLNFSMILMMIIFKNAGNFFEEPRLTAA